MSKYLNEILSVTKDELKNRLKKYLDIDNKSLDIIKSDVLKLNSLFFSDHSPIILSGLEYDGVAMEGNKTSISVEEKFSIS